jgi:hypothetical protein
VSTPGAGGVHPTGNAPAAALPGIGVQAGVQGAVIVARQVAAIVIIAGVKYEVSIGVADNLPSLIIQNLTSPLVTPVIIALAGASALELESGQSSSSSVPMVETLRESADPAGPGVPFAYFGGAVGLDQIGTVPLTISPVCLLYYNAGTLVAKGSSGTPVILATT